MIHHPEAGLGDGSAKNVLGMQRRRGVISDEISQTVAPPRTDLTKAGSVSVCHFSRKMAA
jgi:hypothetical protein